jgi:hypothetical protein
MNIIEKWIQTISSISNDEGLIFVMFQNRPEFRGAVYVALAGIPKGLMTQFVLERNCRAKLHLIKRAQLRGYTDLSYRYAMELNDVLKQVLDHILEAQRFHTEGRNIQSSVIH